MRIRFWLLYLLGLAIFTFSGWSADQWTVLSPDQQIRARVALDSGELTYAVDLRAADGWEPVLLKSPLGVQLQGADYSRGLKLAGAEPQRTVDTSYRLKHGKRREVVTRANILQLAFTAPGGGELRVDFRCQADGVAFRQRVTGTASGPQVLRADAGGFALPEGAQVWCAPSDKASLYTPAYETFYQNGIPVGTPSPLNSGWSFPLLFHTSKGAWALISEAGVGTNFCATRLGHQPEGGLYRLALPLPDEGNGFGPAAPSSLLPWEMPWRVIIVGRTLQPLVASTLVTDVCPPPAETDWDWVKPGRVAWSWWSDNPSPKYASSQKKFVDLAAEMSWEYVLVDANWTTMEEGNVLDVIRYAKEKQIGVLLWYNSGGPHNLVTEKPRDSLTYPSVRQFEFELLSKWGVKGVKVDFFQSDKQNVMEIYHGLMRDAAAKKIMVNFHGCTLPRGWERTYPNLMSMEAVRGAECYIFDPSYPTNAPVQNTILPFTRNAIGPMDYTPVTLSDNRYPHLTTTAHELALSVVFESGWLHFADKPEAYRSLPKTALNFLKQVPVVWDETRLLDGFPGEFVVIARRSGTAWYVGGINGQDKPRQITLNLASLGERRDWMIIEDSTPRRSLSDRKVPTQSAEAVSLTLIGRGGFVAF